MLTLVNSLLALWAVICAVYCMITKRKVVKLVERDRELDERVLVLKKEISKRIIDLQVSAKNYEEAKDAFRAAEEKDAKTP